MHKLYKLNQMKLKPHHPTRKLPILQFPEPIRIADLLSWIHVWIEKVSLVFCQTTVSDL